MSKNCIINGQLVLDKKIVSTNITAVDGIIADISDNIPSDCEIIDAKGRYVTPGLIETHTHGSGGYDFCDSTVDAYKNIVKTHLENGVTYTFPTIMSATFEDMLKTFDIYREAKKSEYGKYMGKLHFEGPYLNPLMCGAQRPDIIRCPKEKEVDILFDKASDIIGRIGAAPEIDGIDYLAKKAKENKVLLSVAHSDATVAELRKAMDMGFSHITHLYSATSTVKKRNQRVCAGILEGAYLYDDINIELIGDGRHVAKETLQMAIKIKGADKINLTSDSMRAAGQKNVKESYLGAICPENRVIIDDVVAKLPDMSFYAGSIATGQSMVKNAVLNYDIPLVDVITMLAKTPARIMNLKNKGTLEIGKDFNVVIWNDDFSIYKVIA